MVFVRHEIEQWVAASLEADGFADEIVRLQFFRGRLVARRAFVDAEPAVGAALEHRADGHQVRRGRTGDQFDQRRACGGHGDIELAAGQERQRVNARSPRHQFEFQAGIPVEAFFDADEPRGDLVVEHPGQADAQFDGRRAAHRDRRLIRWQQIVVDVARGGQEFVDAGKGVFQRKLGGRGCRRSRSATASQPQCQQRRYDCPPTFRHALSQKHLSLRRE